MDSKISTWIKVYTDFLVTQFKTTLKNIKEFIDNSNQGIRDNIADQNEIVSIERDPLMKIMKIISDVQDTDKTHEKVIQRMKDMVNKLKNHSV